MKTKLGLLKSADNFDLCKKTTILKLYFLPIKSQRFQIFTTKTSIFALKTS